VTPQPGSVDHTARENGSVSTEQVGQGLSAFLARVFDQLSITSWLPAVFFVGNSAVLLSMQGSERLVLTDAVQRLASLKWGALVVLIFAVIIIAMTIQAFEFENLRLWEGYYRSRPMQWWATRRIHAGQQKLVALSADFVEQQRLSFDGARRRALDDATTSQRMRAMWNALETVMHGRQLPEADVELAEEAAAVLDWPAKADPARLHRWEITQLKLAEYPHAHRVLPTRLGNVMRAAEDAVELGLGEDLEGFMIRHIDELPPGIVLEHGAYRRRLEMYCGLMFVLGALGLVAVACFWGHSSDLAWRLLVPLLYFGGVWVSYKAAIASALGFGQALREATAWLQNQRATNVARSATSRRPAP
jgi:hypothetical protein